jgi:hypothetical protein
MRLLLATLPLCSLLLAPTAAHADQPVLVLQFSGEATGGFADAPRIFGETMAEVVRATGAEVNQSTRDDVISLAGCAEPSDQCLREALGMLEVAKAVTGEVSPAAGGVAIELREVTADAEPRTRTVVLRGASTAAVQAGFRAEAEAFLADQPSPSESAAATEEQAPPVAPPVVSQPDDRGAGFSAGRVEPYAWAVAGSGAGMVLVGSLLLFAAEGKQSEVDDAPTDTVEDLEQLVELEQSGRRYARWGNAFVVVGAIAAVTGAVLIFKQGRDGDAEAPSMAIAPSATPDGFAVTLTVRGGP